MMGQTAVLSVVYFMRTINQVALVSNRCNSVTLGQITEKAIDRELGPRGHVRTSFSSIALAVFLIGGRPTWRPIIHNTLLNIVIIFWSSSLYFLTLTL